MADDTVPCEHDYPHVAHKYRNPNRGNDGPLSVRCPGVKVPGTARHYRPAVRRTVLGDLRAISRYLSYMISAWNTDSRVWGSGSEETRPRRIEEYPENDAEAWRELRADCDTLIAQLSQLRDAADAAAQHIALKQAAR